MAVETLIAQRWLYSKLSTDSQLLAAIGNDKSRICAEQISEGVRLPAVVFNLLSAEDLRHWDAQALFWTDCVYAVKGVAQTASFGDLATIAARIDGVLHGASGSVTGGVVYAAVRLRPLQYAETGPGGEQYRHLGGVYRVYAKES